MRRRLLCEQRGAISVLAGLSLVVVVASTAMSVDIGKEAWQKRSLQKTVDVISLDAVRAVGDRKDPLVDPYTKALTFAQESATRNNYDYADSLHGKSLTVELGIADATTKAFTVAVPSDYPFANAVRITATTDVPFSFMPGMAHLTTQAVAMVEPEATFSIGSRLARVNTTTSPILNTVLQQMLGNSVSLDVLSYNGLADATIALGPLWTQLGLGTSNQILTQQVSVKGLLQAAAVVLTNQGDGASLAAVTPVNTLASQVNPNLTFTFDKLLNIVQGGPSDAANAKIDVLELIGMAAEVANGNNLMNLTVPITIAGVTSTTLKLSLIEKPSIATGPARKDAAGNWVTRAHTAQARIQLDLTLLQHLVVGLSQGIVHLPVYIEAAGADGSLTNVQCAIPNSNSQITVNATTKVLSAMVGQATDASMLNHSGPAEVLPAQIVNIPLVVNVTGSSSASMPATVADVVVPLNQVRSAGAGSIGLATQLTNNLTLNVQLLGLGLNATTIANSVRAILTPVLSALDGTLLNPLKTALASLGIELGGADVSNLDTHCGRRRLIG